MSAPVLPRQELECDNISRAYGDTVSFKTVNIHRHVSINIGGLTVVEKNSGKINNLCRMIEELQINSLTFSELGLNFKNVPKHEKWSERILGQLDNSYQYITYNTNELSSEPKLWGGTGIIIKDTTAQRYLDAGCDETGLGRWCWYKLRGKLGTVIRILSLYVPINNQGILTVASQHRKYFNKKTQWTYN